MTVIKAAETTRTVLAEGRTRYLAHSSKLMTAVIDFTDGPHAEPDPPHAHPHEQVTYIASGQLYFYIGDQKFEVAEGDLVVIPPDAPHSIQLISKTARLIDNFAPIREDFLA